MEGFKVKNSPYNLTVLFIVMVFPIVLLSFAKESGSLDQQIGDKQTYLADLSIKFNLRHPQNRIVNIICIGNSVPAGYTKTPLVDPFSAYPHLLHKRLKKKYPYAIINVIVSAKGGETSNEGMERYADDVLLFAPDLITIDYALTDRFLSLQNSRNNLSAMVGLAKDSGIKVLLLTPTPDLLVDMNNPNDPLNQQAEQIRKLAREYNVGLVDSYAAFQRYAEQGGKIEDVLSNGRNHPNRKGHEIVTNELLKWFPK
jgi:lysophospholipase L1-like esterase